MKTYTPWEDQRPGFCEVDLVAYCGASAEGASLHTLVPTDVATSWTECVATAKKGQRAVVAALQEARRRLPFRCWGWTPITAASSSTFAWYCWESVGSDKVQIAVISMRHLQGRLRRQSERGIAGTRTMEAGTSRELILSASDAPLNGPPGK